jgi:hypothetical protein
MIPKWFAQARQSRLAGWWVVLPTLLILGLMLVLTSTSGASATSQPRVLLTTVLFQEQKPLCQSCHPKEYADWQNTTHANATLDPAFKEQLSKVANQAACLTCHTTGFDKGSGQFLSEGVTCEACHGPYKEGHPNAATMQLPMASDTCHVCHQQTFKEWEGSQHAANKIECFDCHMAHSQGLRTGSEQTLCAACHSERQTQVAHATHGISGVDCASCHMSQQTMSDTPGMEIKARNHSFAVSADVCAGCHEATIHTSNKLSLAAAAGQADAAKLTEQANRVPELQQQLSDLEQRLASIRNLGIAGSGLAFGFGGFLGLIAGIIGMSIYKRNS